MLVRSVFLICLIASAFAQSGEEAVLGFFSTPQTGHGTYYGPSSSGSCTLDGNLPPVGLTNEIYATVAMNSPQYYGSLSCGMCLQMTGEGVGSGGDPIDGTYIVFVTNLCPECLAGDLDVALNGDGRWDIEWVAVNCPGDYGNLQYMGQGSNSFFLKIQVRNHRVPVAAFYMLNIDGNARIELARSQDNFFIFQSSSELSGDYTVEIESVDGQLLTDVVNIDLIASSQPFNGKNGVQFNGIATSTTVSPSRSPVGGAPSTQNSPSASRSAQGSSARPSTSSSASRTPTRQGSSAAESPSPSRSVGSSASRSPAQASPSPSRSRTRTSFSDTLSSFTSFSSSFTFPSSDSPSDSSSSSAWQIQLSFLVFLVGMLLAC